MIEPTMEAELHFKKGLYKISSHFSRSEVDKLKFILSDFIPRRKLERATSAFHVFCLLESHDALLTRTDVGFFKEILDEVHKAHYIDRYLSDSQPVGLPLDPPYAIQDTQLTLFLANLADDLSKDNVRDVGLFFSGETVRLEEIENVSDGVELFHKLKDAGVNLHQLKDVMKVLSRKDLAKKIDGFLEDKIQSPLGECLKSPELDTTHPLLNRGHQEEGTMELSCR